MIKLLDILHEVEQERIEEGWKENILATAIAASSLFGGAKGQGVQKNKEVPGITQQATSNVLTLDFGSIFPSGRYKIKGDNEKDLLDMLEKIGKYIYKNPNSDYKVEILSSESQVPNYDAEKTGKPELKVKELAEKRAETAKEYIEEYFNRLKRMGGFKGKLDVVTAPVKIGSVKFKSGVDNKDDPKYTKDQYVKLKISAETTATQTDPFEAYAKKGEAIYKGNNLIGRVFYKTRQSADISKQGNVDTGTEDVLFRILKPDTQGDYIKAYAVPSEVWNNKQGAANTVTDEDLQNFEKYKVK